MRWLILLLLVSCTTYQPITHPLGNTWQLEDIAGTGSGTAFPVRCVRSPMGGWEVLFLTAKHVGSDFKTLELHNGRSVGPAFMRSAHPTEDVAVFVTWTDRPIKTRRLSFREPYFGETLLLTGYVAGLGIWTTEGRASTPGRGSFTAYGGCSGGPVMSSDGRVLGVLSAVLAIQYWEGEELKSSETFDSAAYYTPLRSVEDWLRSELDNPPAG